jgi:hypothetical protein
MERLPLSRLGEAKVTLATTLVLPPARAARADARMLARLGL